MKFLLSLFLFFSVNVFAVKLKPQTIVDLRNTSVKIMNLDMNGGGTGSIFRSYKEASHILTNKHVCRLIEQGGYVVKEHKKYLITHYKKFKHHDLCLVRVAHNFKISLSIAQTLAKPADTTYVSGHPSLLPHIMSKGHLSSGMPIKLIVGVKNCTKEDYKKYPGKCGFFGGIPVIEEFDSEVVSNLIKPGSSGSAVFNKYGELIGVVYAGNGRDFSYGFIVPQIYLLYFIQNAHRYSWTKVGTPVDDKGLRGRIFNYEKCEFKIFIKNDEIRKICSKVKDPYIWRQ